MFARWFWDVYAFFYDVLCTLLPYQQMLSDIVGGLGVSLGKRVLDVGAGTGNLEVRLVTGHSPVQIDAIDSSPAMLARARRKCASFPDVNLIQSDGAKLEESEDGYDAIVTSNVLYTLSDPRTVIRQFVRMLKPGGVMVHTTPQAGFSPLGVFWAHCRQCTTWSDVAVTARAIPGLVVIGLLNIPIVMIGRGSRHFWTREELCALFDGIQGLTIEKIEPTYGDQGWIIVCGKENGHADG